MATAVLLFGCSILRISSGSVVNAALNKPARMSSSGGYSEYNASTAVDGNTVADRLDKDQIILTSGSSDLAWWKVDLEREVEDATVRIYFRTDFTWRRNGVKLYTSNRSITYYPKGQLCHTVTGDPSGRDINSTYSVTCPGKYRYILLYTDTNNGGFAPVLDFGEVEVLACAVGTYGLDCTKTCSSRNCGTTATTCERDGRCADGCLSDWTSSHCPEPCGNNFYGVDCSLSCNDRKCDGNFYPCDIKIGLCIGGCQPGYKGADCRQECESTFYGTNCSLPCSGRKCFGSSSPCDHMTGQCVDGCLAGFTGTDCRHECEPGLYGPFCSLSCADRKCVNSTSDCDHVTGQCEGGCLLEFKGADCRLKCDSNVYGSNCSLPCTDRKCTNVSSECDHVTGHCVGGCVAGYRGTDCRETCGSGFYGPECNLSCAYRKCLYSSSLCHHVTGQCDGGCQDGYKEADCVHNINIRNNLSVSTLVAAVVGTSVVLILMCGAILACLVKKGRLQWTKRPVDKKVVEKSGASCSAQMSTISNGEVYDDFYKALDTEQMYGDQNYDVILDKTYQNP